MVTITLILWLTGSWHRYHSVCTRTGMIRYTWTRGPFVGHRLETTPLSEVLTQAGFRERVDHEWIYVHGYGQHYFWEGRYKGAGNGLSLERVVRSPDVAAQVRLLIAHASRQVANRWLDRLFDPELSLPAVRCLEETKGTAAKADFLDRLETSEQERFGAAAIGEE